MSLVVIAFVVVFGQLPRGMTRNEFQVMGRQWLHETIAINATSCAPAKDDSAKFTVKLNARGEVAINIHSVSSATVRSCLELLALATPRFSKEVESAELMITLPEKRADDRSGAIIDEVPLRQPKDSGLGCSKHQDCGAGQLCTGFGSADAGQAAPSRCLDLQRWLSARASESSNRRAP
jgi:hypothetical protein